MRRVVCYVTDETHDRLHIHRRREQRSMSQIAGGIITAALSDRNGEAGWDKDALGADRGVVTPGAEGPAADGGGADTSASPGSPRRPGPVERAMQRRRETK